MKKVLIIALTLMAGIAIGQNYGTIGMPGGTLQGGELDSIAFQYANPSGNVTLSTLDTWYNIDSITIDSGTWLLMSTSRVSDHVSGSVEVRLYDGSTSISSAFGAIDLDNLYASDLGYFSLTIPPMPYVSTTSTKIKLQARNNGGSSATSIKANGVYSGAPSTSIFAIKLSGY